MNFKRVFKFDIFYRFKLITKSGGEVLKTGARFGADVPHVDALTPLSATLSKYFNILNVISEKFITNAKSNVIVYLNYTF